MGPARRERIADRRRSSAHTSDWRCGHASPRGCHRLGPGFGPNQVGCRDLALLLVPTLVPSLVLAPARTSGWAPSAAALRDSFSAWSIGSETVAAQAQTQTAIRGRATPAARLARGTRVALVVPPDARERIGTTLSAVRQKTPLGIAAERIEGPGIRETRSGPKLAADRTEPERSSNSLADWKPLAGMAWAGIPGRVRPGRNTKGLLSAAARRKMTGYAPGSVRHGGTARRAGPRMVPNRK
jgi:hypothetical protein